ncbi:MAG: TolC family protein [Bacteroidaceae bacterium]|nr:TolC family protein [Bacteroidaceae bacterium]
MRTTGITIVLSALLSAGTAHAGESWTLQRCIDYALENNIQIRQGDIAAGQREIDFNTARNNRLPGISAGASQNWSFGRGLTANNTYDNTNTTSTSFNIGTDVTLFAGRRMAGNVKLAELSLEAAKSDMERIKDDIRVSVAQAFIQIVYDRSILDVARGQVTIDSMQVERLTALAAIGKASNVEVASQNATLAQSRLSVTQADNNLKLAVLTLTQLLELPSPEGFAISEPDMREPGFAIPDNPEVIYAQALGVRPSIKSEELRLEQTGTNIEIAKGGFLPTLSLSAGAGTNYYTTSKFKSDAFGDQIKNNFSQYIGLNLSIPVFSRNSNRNNLRSARLNQMNQQMQLDNVRKQLYKEIQQAYYNAVASRSRYESSLSVETGARESFELVQAKYEGGKAGITEFNESKNRLVTAQADVLKYRYEYLFNTALLEFYRNSSFRL